VPVVGDEASIFHIWFDATIPHRIRVHAEERAWQSPSARRWSIEVSDADLADAHAAASDTVAAWIAALGHTRTSP
jgi:hypothetical protein